MDELVAGGRRFIRQPERVGLDPEAGVLKSEGDRQRQARLIAVKNLDKPSATPRTFAGGGVVRSIWTPSR